MKIALICDTFPPDTNSAAIQMRDLSREFARQGHCVSVIVPDANQGSSWDIQELDNIKVLRLRAPATKNKTYILRTLSEVLMPFVMLWHLRKSPLSKVHWDGIVWYSPSIFHGPLVSVLKKRSNCKSYLVIRDIFPEWAADIGLMTKGIPYKILSLIARYQYSVADVIGVQAHGNLSYFCEWKLKYGRKIQVLQNWLAAPAKSQCSIRLENTILKGRRVLVYAGNMGVAQGMDILLDLIYELRDRKDVGFLFIGRGSEAQRLKLIVGKRHLDNILFYDEIHPDSIPDLYMQCSAGILSLDFRHKSHNIPGKFISYMQNGLPVLANINEGNDLVKIIRENKVGQVCDSNQLNELLKSTNKLLEEISANSAGISNECINLFEREYSVKTAVNKIVSALQH